MSYTISLSQEYLKPSMRYIDELVKTRCFPQLLQTGYYPNAKEFTESAGAYEAARRKLRDFAALSDKKVLCLFPGDGKWPRTGSMFALRSAWDCRSIDPLMSVVAAKGIERCLGYKGTTEDYKGYFKPREDAKVIIVAVHSHATLDSAIDMLDEPLRLIHENRLAIISIPCCVPQKVERHMIGIQHSYEDKGIWSPENRVMVWC